MTLQVISSWLKGRQVNAPCDISNNEMKAALISNLAKSILIETVCNVFLTKTTCFYAVSLSIASLISNLAIAIVVPNIFFKSIACSLQYRQVEQQKITQEYSRSGLNKFKTIAQWIPPINFAMLFGTTGNLLIHEMGHIGAASIVYKNLKAQITISGLFSGAVSWTKTGLTPLGSSLGSVNSRLLVCIAGPLNAVLAGTFALIAGIHFKDRFPEGSKYLTSTAVFIIAYQALYALSAFWASKDDLGHDFVMLWHVGIHPIIASIFLASIPLIALSIYKKSRILVHNHF